MYGVLSATVKKINKKLQVEDGNICTLVGKYDFLL